jgi:hypothetical protein
VGELRLFAPLDFVKKNGESCLEEENSNEAKWERKMNDLPLREKG